MDRIITQLGKSRLILAFIVGIGLVVGYLSYSNLEEVVIIDQEIISTADSLESFRSFNLDFSILDREQYKALEIFGESPVSLDITGEKKNPFLPFE